MNKILKYGLYAALAAAIIYIIWYFMKGTVAVPPVNQPLVQNYVDPAGNRGTVTSPTINTAGITHATGGTSGPSLNYSA